MKIQYLSDLHIEFGSQHLLYAMQNCESDVIVIAGDLYTYKGIIKTLQDIGTFSKQHIVYVPGNHEYYRSSKQYVDELLVEHFQDHPNVHVLNNAVWEYNGVVFLGSTGWWTMDKAYEAVKALTDYEWINDLKPAKNGLDWGWESYKFFNENLKKYYGKTVVCVSHNAPALKSIDEGFKDDPLNPCFANAWEHLMLWYKPAVWIHGHMHTSKEYMLDKTLVLRNPYGYMSRAVNKQFDPCKIVEV